MHWYAIHTKPQQEWRAVTNLLAWRINILAPRLWTAPAPQRFLAFFPGYLFAQFDITQMLRNIRFTRGVSSVVSSGGNPMPIENDVIAEIQRRMDENGFIRYREELKPGDVVVVQSGPLKNFTAVFERELPARERVRILLNTVGYSARIEISGAEVRKVKPAPVG